MENKTKIGDIVWWNRKENMTWNNPGYGFICKIYPSHFDGKKIIQATYLVQDFQDSKRYAFQGVFFNQTWGLSS
jgi:hypothetical protein